MWALDIGPCPGAPAARIRSLANRSLAFILKKSPADSQYLLRHEQPVPETPDSLAGKASLEVPGSLTWVPPGTYYVEIVDMAPGDPASAITLYPGADEEYATLEVLPTLANAP